MKAKRLVALLMALVMVVGLFAMTASAVAGITCYTCRGIDGDGTKYTMPKVIGLPETVNPTRVTGCSKMTGYHYHYDRRTLNEKICTYHGSLGTFYTWEYNLCFGG